jgi:hypothetical protein
MTRKSVCACNNKNFLLHIYHSKSKALCKVVNSLVYIDIQFTALLYPHTNPMPNLGLLTHKPTALPQLTDKSQHYPCSIHPQTQSLTQADIQKKSKSNLGFPKHKHAPSLNIFCFVYSFWQLGLELLWGLVFL